MLCKLCQLEEAIKIDSHIIPRFISNWIKETSLLGGLRNVDEPNFRQQDTFKFPLLCSGCEERFFRREDQFAKKIFFPFNNQGILDFAYFDWLLYFAVSLNWRVGVSLIENLRNENPTAAAHLEIALSDWSNFLLEKNSRSEQYATHLFFDCMHHCEEYVGAYYDKKYALRTINYGIPSGSERVAVYIKLPSMVFFSSVYPTDPTGWRNTRILNEGRLISLGQEVTDLFFWEYMRDSALDTMQSMNSMSDKHKRKLEKERRKKGN